jgi:hypothetical protein
MSSFLDDFAALVNSKTSNKGPVGKLRGKDLSESVTDAPQLKKFEGTEPARTQAEAEAFQGAGLPTLSVGSVELGISDFLTPKGLASIGGALLSATGAMAIGSKVAGQVSKLARFNPSQAGALLPDLYYHGTTQAYDEAAEGLKFLTPSSDAAHSYAYGGGGNRISRRKSLIHDYETDKTYEILEGLDDAGFNKIRPAGDSKAPRLIYDEGDKTFYTEGAPMKPDAYFIIKGNLVENPGYRDWVKKYTSVSMEDASVIPEGANIRRTAVDINKPLNLKNPYYKQEDPESFKTLASLDPQGSLIASNIINQAKQGHFSWSDTKYPAHQKVWKDILIPQLEAKGYDSMKYWDDGHDTLAVFSNKNLKSVESLRLPTSDPVAQEQALRNLAEVFGSDITKALQKP